MQLGIRAGVAYFGWLRLDDIFAARGRSGLVLALRGIDCVVELRQDGSAG